MRFAAFVGVMFCAPAAYAQHTPPDVCARVVVATRTPKDATTLDTVAVTRRDVFNAQLERSYVTAKGGLGNIPILLLEANLAGHFVLREFGEPFRHTITNFTFKTNFRFLQGGSAAIRTPTYSPQLTFSIPLPGGGCDAVFLGVRHYSNGQEGDAVVNGQINLLNGNFSTNYAEIGYSHAFVGSGGYVFLRPSIEAHFAQDSLEEADYGKLRGHIAFMVLQSQPRNNGLTNGSHFQFDAYLYSAPTKASQRVGLSATYNYRPPVFEDFGVFVNAYWGRDYYNIWFERNLSVLRLGLMGDNLNFVFR